MARATIMVLILHSAFAVRSFPASLAAKQTDISSVSCVFSRECKIPVPGISVAASTSLLGDSMLRSRTYSGDAGSPAAGLYAYEYRFDPGGVEEMGTSHCIRSFRIPFGPVVSTLDFDGDKLIGDDIFVIKEGPVRTVSISADQDADGNITFSFYPPGCLDNPGEDRRGSYLVGIVSTQPPVTVEAAITEVTGTIHRVSIHAPYHGALCSAPEYEPLYWNDCGGVCGNKYCSCGAVRCDYCEECGETCGTAQCNNNCYNYATNRRTDTFAKPGCGAGFVHNDLSCSSISAAALADGLVTTGTHESCSGGKHKVALVVWPGEDYHWYRLDRNGKWSHKPGKHEVTNVDNSNQAIFNPEKADRGTYIDFCGYFCACSDIRQGQGRQSIK
ncbi:MAG TPA: hypothetical protein VHO84_13595 [Syntrophorhabdaceae bacterium]|nr:hypothetical protein [Syntrophorhabdaceae bacterium]